MATERRRLYPAERLPYLLAAAAARPDGLDLAGFGRGHVVRPPTDLADQALFLDLAPELAQRGLELLGVLDNDLQGESFTSFASGMANRPLGKFAA